jgi:hypothetical protein
VIPTGGERQRRTESEQVQQQEKSQVAALAVQIGSGELSDQARQRHRQPEEWRGEAVRHKHQRKVVVVHCEPVAEGQHDGPFARHNEARDDCRHRQDAGRIGERGNARDHAFRRRPAGQPGEREQRKYQAGREDGKQQRGLPEIDHDRPAAPV